MKQDKKPRPMPRTRPDPDFDQHFKRIHIETNRKTRSSDHISSPLQRPTPTEPASSKFNPSKMLSGDQRAELAAFSETFNSKGPSFCANCFTMSSPSWRKGKDGVTLCNKCGLYWNRHSANRPTELDRSPRYSGINASSRQKKQRKTKKSKKPKRGTIASPVTSNLKPEEQSSSSSSSSTEPSPNFQSLIPDSPTISSFPSPLSLAQETKSRTSKMNLYVDTKARTIVTEDMYTSGFCTSISTTPGSFPASSHSCSSISPFPCIINSDLVSESPAVVPNTFDEIWSPAPSCEFSWVPFYIQEEDEDELVNSGMNKMFNSGIQKPCFH